MEDKELLELAAEAAGIGSPDGIRSDGCWWWYNSTMDGQGRTWNPLGDDGDALRLAVDLRFDILQDECSISIKKWRQVRCESVFLAEQQIEERRSINTRRAIVRAAAEIGKSIP